MTTTIEMRTTELIESVKHELIRINQVTHSNVSMVDEIINGCLWITFSKEEVNGSISIPLPQIDDKNLELITNNDIKRVVCNYWLENEQQELNYHQVMETIICENINKLDPWRDNNPSFLSKIIRSFDQGSANYMIDQLQRRMNEIINSMPLYETDMNSWAMNNRLIIIDEKFNLIRDPNLKLYYQVEKNRKYYERGWTSIGLSDGVLADKNTILKVDLRETIPFGRYHNPQRNLYSTLGMKGDELPKVISITMKKLMDRGISRKGWNLVTAILDTPLNFEDQILVDNRLRGLFTTIERKFVVYNKEVLIKENDKISMGDAMGVSNEGDLITMSLVCDSAIVKKVKPDVANVGTQPIEIQIITIEGKRYLRDGSKFCNMAGNKGVIHFLDLGHAIDPRTGEEVPIDVMISATSINKRKNFSQILEALANNASCEIKESIIEDNKTILIKDDYYTDISVIKNSLKKKGFPEDGVWTISTYCGELAAIVGKIFWGVTKSPEDQLWSKGDTTATNNRDLRVAGLKFSHVELKALTTRFGINNPIISEVMSYAQGIEILQDDVKILRSTIGERDENFPIVKALDAKYVDNSNGTFHDVNEMVGTVVDENFMPEGFVLELPTDYQVIVDKDDPGKCTFGLPQDVITDQGDKDAYTYNKIFIPSSMVRRCWRHGSGKWGLNVIGGYINHIVRCSHDYVNNDHDVSDKIRLMRAITNYFTNVARIMSTKNGELSTYGMSVRYPYSAKATVALSDHLPLNTLEIHRDMANELKVINGDVVIAERFPCLGFMSIRPQYVKVTDDPMCKYIIRASGNSLTSMSLDFDGDTLFIASFHTPRAIETLKSEMRNPNMTCENAISQMNSKKIPQLKEMSLNDFEVHKFPKPSNEEHAELVRKATGVKSHTGPVIALAYNLMRIVENNIPFDDIEEHVHLELLLDFLGNTVFKQKHGIKSLQKEATDAICMADVKAMVNLGFDIKPSLLLCNLIIKEAALVGVYDLVAYHKKAKENGWSKIINRIVRERNKIYFATRASLGPVSLLHHLKQNAVDLPSFTLKKILRSERESIADKLFKLSKQSKKKERKNELTLTSIKQAYDKLSHYIDEIMIREENYDGFKSMDSDWQDKRDSESGRTRRHEASIV